jgi:hypothetical protein
MTDAANLLGLDLNLIDPKDAQSKIIRSCAKCWFEKNASGLHNWGDCSGFVKAVQKDLRLRPFEGQANDIFHELDRRSDWAVLGSGSQALAQAGAAANAGALTIGVWENPRPGKNGHIAIITAYVSLLGNIPEQHAIGGWGRLRKVGHLLERMSLSFGQDKHAHIRYASCRIPILV